MAFDNLTIKSWEYSFDLLKNDGETNKAKIQD